MNKHDKKHVSPMPESAARSNSQSKVRAKFKPPAVTAKCGNKDGEGEGERAAAPMVYHTEANKRSASVMDRTVSRPDNRIRLADPPEAHQFDNNPQLLPLHNVFIDARISRSLRDHQVAGVKFLFECVMGYRHFGGKGCILADEMGLGKTLQCLTVAWTLLKQGPYGGRAVIGNVLVVAPGSLVRNWSSEIRIWFGTERLRSYAVDANCSIEDYISMQHRYPVLIISYEMAAKSATFLRDRCKFGLMVCDEGHRLRSSTQAYGALSSLPIQRRIILTGTPIQNDLRELFSLVDFVNPGVLGTYQDFKYEFEAPIVASRELDASLEVKARGEERAAELSDITSEFVLRRDSSVNTKILPPKTEVIVFCRPSKLQLTLYKFILDTLASQFSTSHDDFGAFSMASEVSTSSGASGCGHLVCINLLKRLCNHPQLVYESVTRKAAPASASGSRKNDEEKENSADGEIVSATLRSAKIFPDRYDRGAWSCEDCGKSEVAISLVREILSRSQGEKIVLVSHSTQMLDLLEALLKGRSQDSLRLDGATPVTKRMDIVDRFNSSYNTSHR